MGEYGDQTDQWHLSQLLLCVCVRAVKEKRVELSTPNLVHYMYIPDRTSACIDPEVKRSMQGHTDKKSVTYRASVWPLLRSYAATAGMVLHVVWTALGF